MKTKIEDQADDLAAARERLRRIHAEQARLAEAAPERASVRDLVEAVKAAKLTVLIEPSPASKTQAAKAQAALDAAVQRRDEAEESERLLAEEAEAVAAEIDRLDSAAERARLEDQKAKLRERIAFNAPSFRVFVKDLVALEGLGGNWRFEDWLPEAALAACGSTARDLLNQGKDLALALRSGKENL